MAILKQSTTFTRMFLLVQSSDHITGLTGATAAVTISKAGGAFASAGGTVTEVSSGWYKIALTTTDTNTLGDLAYHITATSADPTDFVDQVTAAVDQTGDAYVRLGAPAGASVSADVAAVKGDTGTILTDVNTGAGAIYTRLGAPVGASLSADIAGVPAALLDKTDGIETSYTLRHTLRLVLSVLCGKSSGLPTSPVFRDIGDTKDRVTGTLDGNKNRTAVTLDAS